MSNDLLIALIREYEDGYLNLIEVEEAMSDWTKGYLDDLKDRIYYGQPRSNA